MYKLVRYGTTRHIKRSPIDSRPMVFKNAEEAEQYVVLDFGIYDDYELVPLTAKEIEEAKQ